MSSEPNRIHTLLSTPPSTPLARPGHTQSPSQAPSAGQSPSASPPTPSAPPASSPVPSKPGASGSGDGQVQNDHESIKEFAKKLSASLSPRFKDTATKVGSLNLAETSFTAVTVPLAIAYTEASAFFIQDMKNKVDQLGEIEYNVTTVAATWKQAGEKSTVKQA